jgi:hypothetical protein
LIILHLVLLLLKSSHLLLVELCSTTTSEYSNTPRYPNTPSCQAFPPSKSIDMPGKSSRYLLSESNLQKQPPESY